MTGERIRHQRILDGVGAYYTQKILEHGPTHCGVDWNSPQSQVLRFDQLLKVVGPERECSIIDYGCGYGALAGYIRAEGYVGPYLGYDISEEMINQALKQQSELPNCTFTTDLKALGFADYIVASGIFSVKQGVPDEEWLTYVTDTIKEIAEHSRKGFSFNMLTAYADWTRPDLFYGDPRFFIDHCIRNYSRHVAMLHNYGLYEFTILVSADKT
ncbi:hypothetical protein A2115_03100 [Candidatus Woesebacteria bacterium GWA1_41_8]|uniref:Uncharacterized protein n=1 Tax=Candidatus Woesebacteria bacterium GWA1_41_8 TaxID=1802471 RepID=A0A1F7WHV4_9BACT|nr:MAG: hypothetical protein A2115_03100 [Candidatus Woesebacteria bacterium GWA1_41_8]